jgi:hypothetical protein
MQVTWKPRRLAVGTNIHIRAYRAMKTSPNDIPYTAAYCEMRRVEMRYERTYLKHRTPGCFMAGRLVSARSRAYPRGNTLTLFLS